MSARRSIQPSLNFDEPTPNKPLSRLQAYLIEIKASLRAAKARTREELERALVAALELVTTADCAGWFRHCGYQVARNRN